MQARTHTKMRENAVTNMRKREKKGKKKKEKKRKGNRYYKTKRREVRKLEISMKESKDEVQLGLEK